MILPLISADALDCESSGKKAASLAQAGLAGIPVLPGFVITTAELNAHISSRPELLSLWNQICGGTYANLSLEMNLYKLQKEITLHPLSTALLGIIYEWLQTLRDVEYIVLRSSSILEDGHDYSSAGMYTSVIKVRKDSLEDVEAAILAIWASALNLPLLRVVEGKTNGGFRKLGMAVLVQPYLETEVGGVLFTAHPMSTRSEVMLLEAVNGGTHNLVNGSNPAMRAVCSRKFASRPDKFEVEGAYLLSKKHISELFEFGRILEKLYQQPLDIEWGFVNETLKIFQARPITTLRKVQREAWVPFEVVDIDAVETCMHKDLHEAKVLLDRWMEKKYWMRKAAKQTSVATYGGFYIGITRDALNDESFVEKRNAILASIRTPFVHVELGRMEKAILRSQELFAYLYTHVPDDQQTHVFRVREYIPNEVSGFAAVTPDNVIYIEFAPGGLMGLMCGDVPVSTYRLYPDGSIKANLVPAERCYLVNPQTASFEMTDHPYSDPGLSAEQLAQIENLARHMQKQFGQPRLEWYIWDNCLYFSDMTIEQGELTISNNGTIISSGVAHGSAFVINDDLMNDLLKTSHEFNISVRPNEEDERAKKSNAVQELLDEIKKVGGDVILISSMPVNSLLLAIPYVRGIICESGAMLCHLAICLREAHVPGLVVADVRKTISSGDIVTIQDDGRFQCISRKSL